MPIIGDNFTPNLVFRNKHINTLYRYFKPIKQVNYTRKRFDTSDSDFLDLDCSLVNSDKLILAIHGLEGSSNSKYIQALCHEANKEGYDVIAINLRGCSGVPNHKLASYHSGKTDDIIEIVQHYTKKYDEINLVGYSLGGNIVLKLMGEFNQSHANLIHKAVGVSAPCDLKGSAQMLSLFENRLYQANFIKTLKEKAKEKINRHPEYNLEKEKILSALSFKEFDNYFTAPTHGFVDAEEYWDKSSSKAFLTRINKPT